MTRPRSRSGNQRWPATRRPGIIPGRRFALALALVWLSCPGGVASAAGNASQLVTATVYQPGTAATSDSVSVGALETNSCPTYAGPTNDFLGPTGDTSLPPSTWSLASVLGCLATPVPLIGVTGVSVQRQNGSFENTPAAQLSRSDLTPPGDFPTSGEVPVISSDGSNIIYNRPKRGPGDNNLGDYVLASDPSAFVVDVFEGPPLTVKVNASPATVAVGGKVSFSATVTGSQATDLTYNWNFGGVGMTSTLMTPSETFYAGGTYSVTLQVGDAAGGGGTDTVLITVGTKALAGPGGQQQPGTGPSPKSPSPTGPKKSQGHHVGGPAGKSNGNGTGTTKPTRRKTTTPPHKNTSRRSTQAGSRSPSRTTTPTKRAAATRHRSGAAGKPPASGSTFDPAHAPLVTGRLVSDVRLLSPASSPFVHAVPASLATAPPSRRAIRASLLPGLAGASGVVLLLALGAGRELRGRRGWRGWRLARAGN